MIRLLIISFLFTTIWSSELLLYVESNVPGITEQQLQELASTFAAQHDHSIRFNDPESQISIPFISITIEQDSDDQSFFLFYSLYNTPLTVSVNSIGIKFKELDTPTLEGQIDLPKSATLPELLHLYSSLFVQMNYYLKSSAN